MLILGYFILSTIVFLLKSRVAENKNNCVTGYTVGFSLLSVLPILRKLMLYLKNIFNFTIEVLEKEAKKKLSEKCSKNLKRDWISKCMKLMIKNCILSITLNNSWL